MTNAQILKDRIKKQCEIQGKSTTLMLSELSLGINAINQINEKKGMGSFTLAKIADYLDVSTDYLLGRTDEPNVKFENVHYSNIVNDTNGDNSPMTVPQEQAELDETTQQLVNAFRHLDLAGKAKVMGVVAELINGN